MTIFGYIRVNTLDQESNTSLTTQTQILIGAGVPPQNIYSDCSSGSNFERTNFEKLLFSVKEGDEICVAFLDRFSRNLSEALDLISTLKKKELL